MTQPAGSPMKIGDLINKVKANLQNRSDVNETVLNPEMRPSAWIRDALREMSANYPFNELQVTGPMVTVGPGMGFQGSNYMYPVSKFLNPGDDVTLTEDPVIFLTAAQAASAGFSVGTTTNVVGYGLDYLSVKAIQSLIFIPGGIPSKYTRYGNMFWFGTQPGSNYNMYLPYQVRHPFNADNLTATPIKIPEDWLNILSWAAAEVGAINLRWNDQADFIHKILYGDPTSMRDGVLDRPGLIAAKVFQPERDQRLSPVMMTPFAQRY